VLLLVSFLLLFVSLGMYTFIPNTNEGEAKNIKKHFGQLAV
jgi:hypothetical protein